MISKELLSEVLDIKLYWRDIKIVDNIVHYPHENGIYNEVKTINIYELAHKCKEWAFSQGYKTPSFRHNENRCFCRIFKDSKELNFCVEATESEAIFKACEWIKEQHDN